MDIFSNLQVIGECLLDRRRVFGFNKAIQEIVKPGDIVLDVGTGSGILALFAARAGAKKVYAIEIAKDVAEFARLNIRANNFSDKIEVISADGRDFNFPQGVDVVTAELLDTWLVAEHQAHVLNSLRSKKIIDSDTKLIPYSLDCVVELMEYDFNFYGFAMPFVIQARNFGVNQKINKKLSVPVLFEKIDFNKFIDTEVSKQIEVEVKTDGLLNSIWLSARTYLSPRCRIWGTSDMNMPVVVPINPQKVSRGNRVTVIVKYKMGEGFEQFSAKIA